MSLPRFMVLRSNATNKYLCYGKNNATLSFSHQMKHPNLDAHFLESEKKKEVSSLESEEMNQFNLLKFEVEESKTAQGFVHIRTCYNNKYWVRKCKDSSEIVAEAHEPEEDETKWSCTLFKPIFVGEAENEEASCLFANKHGIGMTPQKIQLMHMEQYYVVVGSGSSGMELSKLDSGKHTLTSYDVEPTVIFPKTVTFMGQDGKYLSSLNDGNLGFVASDVGANGVAMWTVRWGSPVLVIICMRDEDSRWYLKSGEWDQNRVGTTNGRTNAYFGAVKVGDRVALYCPTNKNFLQRVPIGSFEGMVANFGTITEQSKVRIGEPVISREFLSAEYDLSNARTYGTNSVNKFSDTRSNNTSVVQNGTFQVEYKSVQTTTWSNSVNAIIGVKATWSCGIPKIGDIGLEISYQRGETWEWGEEKTNEQTIQYTQNVTIPPKKKVTLKVVATKAFCDVPFTCVVRDLMTDGTTREYTKTDGLFTGANEFEFQTLIHEEDL